MKAMVAICSKIMFLVVANTRKLNETFCIYTILKKKIIRLIAELLVASVLAVH